MSKIPTRSTKEARRLDDLIDHPLQAIYNDGLSEEALQDLAEDIKVNGLREQIQIMPENRAGLAKNTILDGHQRRHALLMSGVSKTMVNVRYDLATANAVTVEREFLKFNALRQQRDKLLEARTALRLYELERNRKDDDAVYEWEARERVGKIIGMSGRNLKRYFNLLHTPVPVQNAFRAGKLQLVVAEKVADLGAGTQETVAVRIKAGEDPRKVVAQYLPRKEAKPGLALHRLVRALALGQKELGDKIQEVRGGLFSSTLEDLRKGKNLIDTLIMQLTKTSKQSGDKLKRMFADSEE